jgi:CBS domain-containing protein
MTMKTREVMTPQVEVISRDATVEDAAAAMARLDIGALPVAANDGRLEGMITDRDVAVKVVAEGRDPRTTLVGEISKKAGVATVGADDSVDDALRIMKERAVRRLPVVDDHEVVGILSQADIARNVPNDATGDLVGAISKAPPD